MTNTPDIDDQTIALITERVVEALRDELEAIAIGLMGQDASHPLTVGQVAARFGVARSTVYAHWREWGGYKLGNSAKAPIRFEGPALPATPSTTRATEPAPTPRPTRKRQRRQLISDTPRFDQSVEELG